MLNVLQLLFDVHDLFELTHDTSRKDDFLSKGVTIERCRSDSGLFLISHTHKGYSICLTGVGVNRDLNSTLFNDIVLLGEHGLDELIQLY